MGRIAGSGKSKSKTNMTNEDVRRETPLQAILFADSFSETFRPITLETPKVLLPLVNVPMLEYSLEFLASSGVEEVILFCTYHSDQVEHFVREQSLAAKRVHVRCISSPTSITAGDALREIDRQQLIHSDPFILMSGDVIANVELQPIIEEHRDRKRGDSNCIMTSVFKEMPTTFSTNIRPLQNELVVGIDRDTFQIVLYDDQAQESVTSIPTIFLEDHAQIAVRADLLDCYIDICSPEVLLKFAEDFDYQDLRRDFFHNEVQNYELGKKFFARIISDKFAARVMDPRTYGGISRAILQRWVFPMVPDNNYLGGEPTNYTYHRGMIYKDENLKMARTSLIQRESMIGGNTSLGEQTSVLKSVIGRNCRIGNHVTIQGSFIWSNVVIGDNVSITNAIVCDNVVIRNNATIPEGCILSYNVCIGTGFALKPFSKVTVSLTSGDDDAFQEDSQDVETRHARNSIPENQTWNPNEVGHDGMGRLWTFDDDDIEVDSDDDNDEYEDTSEDQQRSSLMENRRLEKLKCSLIGGDDVVLKRAHRYDEWETLSSSEDEEDESPYLAVEIPFEKVIHEMILNGDRAGHGTDDVFLEIKSYKFAQNRSFADILGAIFPALFDLVPQDKTSAMERVGYLKLKFQKWDSVIQRCLVEESDQLAVIHGMETFCVPRSEWVCLFHFVLQLVYDLEWVSEESILKWYDTLDTTSLKTTEVAAFIDWLQQDQDEEDSE